MKRLKYLGVICLILGVISLTFGWFQSWDIGVRSNEYETVMIYRTVRFYVFIVGGFILIIISLIIQSIRNELKKIIE